MQNPTGYLEGTSCKKIAKGLECDGILTSRGKKKWHDTSIRLILENEKYMGDVLLQKTYTVDYLQKKRVKNTSIMPQYYIEDDHEAIIPKDIYHFEKFIMCSDSDVPIEPCSRKPNLVILLPDFITSS